jgi:hypothetical protein
MYKILLVIMLLPYYGCKSSKSKDLLIKDKTHNNIQKEYLDENIDFSNLYHKGIDTLIIIKKDTFILRDLSTEFNFVVSQTDTNIHNHSHDSNYEYWQKYLSVPHPNVNTIRKYFKDASEEFDVPISILFAIGQIENNWTQIGPTIDQGWGIMHLVKNSYSNTLDEAAQLLGLNSQVLKDDAKQNIRGAASLIAKYAGEKRKEYSSYEEWYPAMKKFSGLINDQIQEMQLKEYKRVLYQGVQSKTLWGEEIHLSPQSKIYRK